MRIAGKGGGKGLNLIVVGHDSAVAKDKEGKPVRQYLDIQRDLRDPAGADEPHPHAATYTDKKGKISNGVGYSPKQVDKIVEAMKEAGNYRHNAERGRFEGTIKGDMFVSDKIGPRDNPSKGLVLNTAAPLEASDYGIDENTLDQQYDMAESNREEMRKEQAKSKEEAEKPAAEKPAATKTAAKKPAAKKPAAKKASVKTSTAKAAKESEGTETEKDQPDVG